MAIISSIPGLEVWIDINGKPATEYDDPDNEVEGLGLSEFDVPPDHGPQPPCVIKYIEAKHGETFSFHYFGRRSVRKPGQSILPRFWIDGTKLYGEFDKKHDPVRGGPVTAVSRSCYPKDGYRRHSFLFSPLAIVETGRVPEKDAQDMKQCGILQVAFFHTAKPRNHFEHDIRSSRSKGGDTGAHVIAEKALKGKAVDCKTTYVPSPDDPTRKKYKTYDRHFLDDRSRPLAVFEFRYQSKEGLIKEGIIPLPALKDEVNTMTNAEVRGRLGDWMEEKNKSSLHNDVDNEDPIEITSVRKTQKGRGIKREAPAMVKNELRTRYKTRRLDNGRVEIDLTDD